MMEFTLARLTMAVCGVILLASVIPPVASLFENEEDAGMQEQSEVLCRMIDAFYQSEADEMIICLNTVLPQGSSVSIDGYLITMIDGEDGYTFNTEHPVISDRGVYSGNDYVRFTKNSSCVMMEAL